MEIGSFTPPRFLAQTEEWGILSDIAGKRRVLYAGAISWLRTCISLDILRSVHRCVRGSRTPFHKNLDFLDDFSVIARNDDIFKI